MKWLYHIVSTVTFLVMQGIPFILFPLLNRTPINSDQEFITVLLYWTVFQAPLLVLVIFTVRISTWIQELKQPKWLLLGVGGIVLWFLNNIFATQSLLFITNRPIAQSFSELIEHTLISSALWIVVIGMLGIELWDIQKYNRSKSDRDQ